MKRARVTMTADAWTATAKIGGAWFVQYAKSDNGDGTVTCWRSPVAGGSEPTAAEAKEIVSEAIAAYDTSDAVNSFTLQGRTVWLDKATRVGLVNSCNVEQAAGKTDTTLWYDGVKYEMPITTALSLLSQLELYALESYNATQSHLAAVAALDSVEEVCAYDYTAGYPEKPTFSV